MNPWRAHPVPAMRARGALRRPHRALLRRAAGEPARDVRARACARAAAARRAWSARAGAGAMREADARGRAPRRRARRARHRRRRPGACCSRQPARVRVRAARRCSGSARSRCRSASASSGPGWPTSPRQCGATASSSTPRSPTACRCRARRRRCARCRRGDGVGAWRALGARPAPPCRPPRRDAETDTAVILYTSGTTGQPEGRDADPPDIVALGAALRGLHAPAAPTTARRWRCRPATSPA